MAEILILGAGVMGSALTVPAADNGHRITLAATPKDHAILKALESDAGAHPRLGAPISPAVRVVDAAAISPHEAQAADLVVVGVSTPGIPWAAAELARLRPTGTLALVTKGLVANPGSVPFTFADALPELVASHGVPVPRNLVGIGGPCIAREVAERRPSATIYGSANIAAARHAKELLEAPYYRVSVSEDAVGLEACAALKNFFAIGVSSMLSRHQRDGVSLKNPLAAAFQQALDEMAVLAEWLGGTRQTAYGLAGVGDLHVTVGGGRNSRLGKFLGEGMTVKEALTGPLAGETVEGVDVGRVLAPYLNTSEDGLDPAQFPLAAALTSAIVDGGELHYEAASSAQHLYRRVEASGTETAK
ncbi:MAG: glycerol-3-phosphate dehydrogenase [Pseudomonadota bacterium]